METNKTNAYAAPKKVALPVVVTIRFESCFDTKRPQNASTNCNEICDKPMENWEASGVPE
jgi:hypothetical protein